MTTKEAFDITVSALREKGYTSEEILDLISNLLTAKISAIRNEEQTSIGNKQTKLMDLLLRLGITRNVAGYRYIIEAVLAYDEDPNQLITRGIYPKVAKKCNVTISRVERAMRYAIEKGFDNMHAAEVDDFFGNTIDFNKGRPTNSEFIALCAEWINR